MFRSCILHLASESPKSSRGSQNSFSGPATKQLLNKYLLQICIQSRCVCVCVCECVREENTFIDDDVSSCMFTRKQNSVLFSVKTSILCRHLFTRSESILWLLPFVSGKEIIYKKCLSLEVFTELHRCQKIQGKDHCLTIFLLHVR